MRVWSLVGRALSGVLLVGIPVAFVGVNSPHLLVWALLANANTLLLIAACWLLFVIKYA